MMSINDTHRKYHDKEAFVTGHSGSTSYEILLLCMVIPVGLCLYYKLLPLADDKKKKIGIEFITLILPMLVVQTSLLPSISGPIMLFWGMLLVAYQVPTVSRQQHVTKIHNKEAERPAFLSIHRSSVYLLTSVAILAVDFHIFPRKYCKTETFGYGWMDLGAASFVIISGLTSSLSSTTLDRKGRLSNKNSTSYKMVKKCAPLLLLGVIRLLTNKGLEYQEHISEYGVHWNFFFTLCFIEGLIVMLKKSKNTMNINNTLLNGFVAGASMVTYQIYLSFGGQDFIENFERRCTFDYSEQWTVCDAFYANREGILGLIGYVSLRILSEEIGQFCFVTAEDQSRKNKTRQLRLLMVTLLLWAIHFGLTIRLQISTSRRSTNLPFILWALAHNMTVLFAIDCVTTSYSKNIDNKALLVPCILDVVNRYGLAVFLLSNILTGLVNLTVNTLYSSDQKAMAILSAYLALVCGSALLIDKLLGSEKK